MPARHRSTLARAGRLSLSLLLAPAAACTSWRTQAGSPSQVLTARQPSTARVTRADGSSVIVHGPRIVGDTLSGWSGNSGAQDGGRPVQVPLSDIRSIEIRRTSAGKTILLLAGIGVTAAVVAAAASSDPSVQPSPGSGGGGGGGGGGPYVSCPLVYSWDGHGWRLDSGTFGGAISRGLARTDVDNLAYATVANGVLRLKVANELAETDYLDELGVLAVDAPAGSTVSPDASGGLHTVTAPVAPVSARDFGDRDATARVRDADGWHWESNPAGRDSSRASDRRDGLELRFVRPAHVTRARLVLDANNTPWSAALTARFVTAHGAATRAWYDSLDASPAMARALGTRIARQAFLSVAVRVGDRWVPQGLAWEAGPEISTRQVVPLDLAGVEGDTVIVRLESVPSFWLVDRAAIDFAPERSVTIHELRPDAAYGAGGRDRLAAIARADGVADTLRTGDSLLVSFRVPPVPAAPSAASCSAPRGWYRIDSPESGPPDVALLERVLEEPDGLSGWRRPDCRRPWPPSTSQPVSRPCEIWITGIGAVSAAGVGVPALRSLPDRRARRGRTPASAFPLDRRRIPTPAPSRMTRRLGAQRRLFATAAEEAWQGAGLNAAPPVPARCDVLEGNRWARSRRWWPRPGRDRGASLGRTTPRIWSGS